MGHGDANSPADLHVRFRRRMAADCVGLMACLPELDGNTRARTLERIRETAHRIAGSAGAFGFDRIGALALAAERVAKDALAAPGADATPVAQAVRRLCAEVAGLHAR